MRHLISQLIDEEVQNSLYPTESATDFLERIHKHLMDEFNHLRGYAPFEVNEEIREEILKQVTDIYRIKTYGHYSLISYKKSLFKKVG